MTAPNPTADLAPINRIRVETALSRFPVHCLAKKGNVSIDLQHSSDSHQAFRWKVSYNSEFGQPGPLAYKVDTIVVNRRIDEAPRPLPEVIRLGSLREICRELGVTDHNTDVIKTALHQNASAYITAKIRFKTKTGKERWGELGYTRYSVIFTGEVLPDGTIADAVYLALNASYRDLLNHVEVRPLDYDYLMLLPPGPQRFYELLSFQVYGALASGRPRAKMLYSEYCKYAPQSRYPDFEHVKKQMFKIHVPHRESGYITKIEYQQTVDAEGRPDWEMLYTPGPKAVAEFEAFTYRQARQQPHPATELPSLSSPSNQLSSSTLQQQPNVDPTLLAEMIRRGIAEKKARELLANLKPQQDVMDQLEYVDFIVAKDARGKVENPPGLYIFHIRDNIVPPADFPTSRKRKFADQAQQVRLTETSRRAQLKTEYETYCTTETKRYIREVLPPEEYQQLFQHHRRNNRRLLKNSTDEQIEELTQGTIRAEIQQSGRVKFLSFEEFCQQQSESAA